MKIKFLHTFLLLLLALVSCDENSSALRLNSILSDYNKREASSHETKAHIDWIKTPAGKEEAAYLAEHYDRLEVSQKAEVPMELARTGAPAVVALIKKSLADPAHGHSAMSGVFYACLYEYADSQFKRELAPALIPWIGKGDFPWKDQAINLLPQMDPELASRVLFTDEYLTPNAPLADLVLTSCNEASLKVPILRIQQLLEAWEVSAFDPKAESRVVRGYRQAVRSLASHEPEAAMKIADQIIRKNPHESENFSEVPLAAAGLTGLYACICKHALDNEEFSKLPEAAQIFFAVIAFEGDTSNGGISQALGNSTGDYLPLVRKGYEQIGDKRGLQFLDFMLKPFGPEGPSQDREKRNLQMDTMNPTYLDQEDSLYEKWYNESKDDKSLNTIWLLNLYAARNVKILKPLMTAPANR